MDKNKYIIAAAGSGKTTHIVNEALRCVGNVLILTYTTSNRDEIYEKVITTKGNIPSNITIMTWFSFLITHGVKPYQGELHPIFQDFKINGLLLCTTGKEGKRPIYLAANKKRWVVFNEKEDPIRHYCTNDGRLYSDRVAKFVVRTDMATKGKVRHRISAIFQYIFIDEVQDLTGYDLDILSMFFKTNSTITLVGDPRQYVFSTHIDAKKNKRYRNGNIRGYIEEKCSHDCIIDENSLQRSHRNSSKICSFSSLLFTGEYPQTSPCLCSECESLRNPSSIKCIHRSEAISILENTTKIVQLTYDKRTNIIPNNRAVNFGISKGRTFNSVIIYPTKDMKEWLRDSTKELKPTTKSKLYVAITRARQNVYFLFEDNENLPNLVI